MPRLFIYPKKGEAFWHNLKPERISIGRSEDNELPLPDPFSSGHHALIYPSDGKFVIRDNGSKNGIFLNGKKIQGEVELKKGDEILIGSTRIIFDKELSSNVEMTEVVSPARNINTILHLREILKKEDIETTLQEIASPSDLMKIKSDYKSLAVLNEVSKALVLHQPLNELLERVMELISEYMPMDRGILMIKEGNPPQLIPKVIRINNKSLAQKKIQVSQSIVNLVLDKHSSVLTTDALADPRFMMKDSVIKSNIHSAMCVPLWNNKEIIGVIYSDRISLVDQFSQDDLRLLTLLSNLAAVKIENARLVEKAIEQEKMEKELALAARIQKDFLPKEKPVCEKFDIAGTNIPCHQVGGDYYDFLSIDPCRLGVIVADVSGKGISASLLMASLRAALYSELHPKVKLSEMATKLNNFVHRSSAVNMFITFFFCELDMNTGQFRYINAGHNPPLLIRKNGKVERLESCGFCLGMFPAVSYEVKEAGFNPGDCVVFYTDGITENRNKNNEEYGEERLINFLKKNIKQSASMIVEKVCQEMAAFSTGVPPLDDMTFIIVKRVS
ncbi:MAG: SpoIIE family protein phosphatase [Clostridiales bacterium]|nr:SpoIIE family protein phosphatase [Clostridiales bacterium]